MSTASLLGRVVIITGAGRGIGRESALLMAREGASVVVNDAGATLEGDCIDRSLADNVVREIVARGGRAIADSSDISRAGSGQELVDLARDTFGSVDAVVNNAGIMRGGPIPELDDASWERVLDVNLAGAFRLSRAAARHFVRQRSGAFVHMTSTAALIGTRNHANYAASKFGIAALSRSLAIELAAHGVRSNCVAPLAYSRMTTGATGRQDDDPVVVRQREAEGAAAVAPVVAYLAGGGSADVNGQIFGVRGKEISLYSQPRPVRTMHQGDGWTVDKLDRVLAPAWSSAFTPVEVTRQVFTWEVA